MTAAIPLDFCADAGALAKALALLRPFATRRGSIPALLCVLVEATPAGLELTATDLDARLTIALPATVESSGRALVEGFAFGDALKAMAKVKRAQCGAKVDEEAGRLVLCSGRSRVSLKLWPVDDFPVSVAWDAAETWTATPAGMADPRVDDVALSADAAKVLAKVAKRAGDATATVERREVDGEVNGLRVTVADCTFTARLDAPCLYGTARRDPYSYGYDSTAEREALAYLRTMRRAHGLPMIAGHDGRLTIHNGRATALTVGECRRDYNETRPAPDGWQPPEGCEIEVSGVMQSCEVEGVEYVRLHEQPWSFRYVAEQPGALIWDDGAYSLPMPAGERRAIATITVEVDGDVIPLRCKHGAGDATGAIELTPEQVGELCGPVDPSTFVNLPSLAFHHGRIIATGEPASRFNALQRAHCKRLRKIEKGSHVGKLESYAAECDAFAPVIAALIAGENVTDAAIQAAGGLPREVDPSAVVLGRFAPEEVEPVEEPSNVVHVQFAALAEVEPEPAAPETEGALAVEVEPAPDPAPIEQPAANAAPSGLERRLARVEAALGLVERPKRSPAHAAAIRRAWTMRREMLRVKAHAARCAQSFAEVQSQRAACIAETSSLSERLAKAEQFASGERAELVAEIDALREAAEVAARRLRQYDADVPLMCGEVETLRRDLARTRAERDGIAGNLAAMTTRAAADAQAIEALGGQPTGRRFILSSR